MPLDEARAEEARAWLTKAGQDLRDATTLLGAHPPSRGSAAFHAQQAAEKALKAYLAWHERPFRKTHDLAELGQQVSDIDQSLLELCQRADELTVYAWIFRYPGEPSEPTMTDARKAVELAQEVLTSIETRLPSEAQ